MHTHRKDRGIKGFGIKSTVKRTADRLKGWWRARGMGRAELVESLESRTLMAAYVVNDTSDNLTTPAVGSLRWAINSANADAESSSISFDLAPGPNTIVLAGGYLLITESLSMTGAATADELVIDGRGLSRVLKVTGGDVSIQGMTITGGAVTDDIGSGVLAYGASSLILTQVKITGNTATDTGSSGSVKVMGVGLYSNAPSVTITDSEISNNSSAGGGLGIGAHFAATGETDVQIYSSKVTGNMATITTTIAEGAGLYFAAGVTGGLGLTEVSTNTFDFQNQDISSPRGVGIFNNGSLTLYQTMVHANTSNTPGTYAYVHGGGIFSDGGLNITQSEVSYNVIGRGPGAGVFAYGTLNIYNSTVAYNKIESEGQAAGVYYSPSYYTGLPTPILLNATIYGNTVLEDPGSTTTGGLYADPSNPVKVINSVIAGNTVTSLGVTTPTDVSGFIKTEGGNLIYDMSRATKSGQPVVTGVDPNLDTELDFHGGSTRTLVPLENSPVIDAGDQLFSTGTDQRGFFRSTVSNGGDGTNDLGAVEAYGIISGYVFYDVNGNGIYDREDGTPGGGGGSYVHLYEVGPDGTQGTVDDAFVSQVYQETVYGYFSFNDLADGTYYLRVEVPSGYYFGTQHLDTPGASQVYVDGVSKGQTPTYVVVKGSYHEGISAAVVEPTSLETLVFVDVDKNGAYDPGVDTVAAGAKVTITGSEGQPTVELVSDASGIVTFTNTQVAGGGTYTLTLGEVPGYQALNATVGSLGGSWEDANTIYGIQVPGAGMGTGYAFGLTPNIVATASVSGSIFEDTNQNGVQDGEANLVGALIKLYDVGVDGVQDTADDVLVTEATSDGSGAYYFGSLVASQYYVKVTSPSLYRITKQDLSSTGGSRVDDSGVHEGNTPVYTLEEGQGLSDINAGFVGFIAISVIVFEDTGEDPAGFPDPIVPGNGLYDSSHDKALESAQVTITGVADKDGSTVTQTQTTNEFGNVYFYILEPGTYTISVLTPDGLRATKAVFTGTHGGTVSGDYLSVTGVTAGSGEVAEGYRFAFMPKAVVTGTAFHDLNQDGLNNDDASVAGATVTLYEAGADGVAGTGDETVAGTQTTDTGGMYAFTGLDGGNYYTVFGLPVYGRFTKQDLTSTGGSRADASGQTPVVAVAEGEAISDINAGVVEFASLKVVAFVDTGADPGATPSPIVPGDGAYTEGVDPLLAGVTVTITGTLFVDGSTFSASEKTDGFESAVFSGLEPGVYTITVTTPEGVKVTQAIVSGGGSGTPSGDGLSISGVSRSAGETDGDYQFAFEPVAYLSGTVFVDPDFDGAFTDKIDSVLAGASLELLKFNGAGYDVVGATVTDAQGHWYFGDLVAGETYKVVQVSAGSYVVGFANAGAAGGNYSGTEANAITGIVLSDDQAGVGYFFANVTPNVVAGSVLSEQQSGPVVGLFDVTVHLTAVDKTGASHSYSTQTDSAGAFNFSSLVPGTYTLTLSGVPVGQVFDDITPGLAGGTASGSTLTVDLSTQTGVVAINNAFNYHEQGGSISGTVFNDADQDGLLNGELGVLGTRVDLFGLGVDGVLSEDDELIGQVFTNTLGHYGFVDLRAGEYYLHFVAPTGYFITPENSGFTNGSQASDIGNGVSSTSTITLAEKADLAGVYAGMTQETSFKAFVYEDSNGNGLFDSGTESGLSGVNVVLDNSLGSPRTTVATDKDGYVTFTNSQVVAKGEYSLFLDATLINYISATAGTYAGTVSGANDIISGIVIPAGGQGDGYAFGVQRITKGVFGGVIFEDINQDGDKGSGEDATVGVTARLFSVGVDGIEGTGDDVETASGVFTGAYSFGDVEPGSYYVNFVLPSEARFTGLGGGATANVVGAFARTGVYTVVAGGGPTGVYAGYVRFASVTVQAFSDSGSDGSGIFPNNVQYNTGLDANLADVQVTITGVADKDGSTFTTTLTTDTVGKVVFSGLEPGVYSVSVAPKAGFKQTGAIIETGGGAGDGKSISGIDLESGTNNGLYRFAYLPVGSLSGYVYLDATGNGSYDVGTESPVEGVTMQLTVPSGSGAGFDLVATTTTDASGNWTFGNLDSGIAYRVVEVLPGGQLVEAAGGGTVPGTYGPTDPNAVSGLILGLGENGNGIAFSNSEPNVVSGTVVGNPVMGGAAVGLEGVQVRLTANDSSKTTFTAVTGADGSYSFMGLYRASYALEIDSGVPTGFAFSNVVLGALGGVASGQTITAIDLNYSSGAVAWGNTFVYNETLRSPTVTGISFEDVNLNDVYDPGVDAPIQGAKLEIIRFEESESGGFYETVGTVTTGADGVWTFGGTLEADGTYKVVQTADGYLAMRGMVGTAGGLSSPFAGNVIDGIVPGVNQDATGYAFANVRPNFIVGTAVNVDQKSQVPGVTIKLYIQDDLGERTVSTTTDGDGEFDFGALRPGVYKVELEHLPGGHLFQSLFIRPEATTTDPFSEVDLAGQTGQQSGFDFLLEDSKTSVSGVVFEDYNQDGRDNDDEATLEGTHVWLYSVGVDGVAGTGDDVLADEEDVDNLGGYSFEQPAPGMYYVRFETDGSKRLTKQDLGNTDGNSADVQGVTGVFEVTASQGKAHVNAGFVRFVTLQIVGFSDTGANESAFPDPIVERNGVYDPGTDPGLAGVLVAVTGIEDGDSTYSNTVLTDSSGLVTLTGLEPGIYSVTTNVPQGVKGVSGRTISEIDLSSGQASSPQTFAYLPVAFVSGTVFEDKNANDAYDPGTDATMPGVVMELHRFNGDGVGYQQVSSTTTDSQGHWYFGELDSFTDYRVVQVTPAGYVVGKGIVGTAFGEYNAGDPNAVSGINLFEEQAGTGYGFANFIPNYVTGTVSAKPTETGAPYIPMVGIELRLTNPEGFPAVTTFTNSDGSYDFGFLRSGKFSIEIVSPDPVLFKYDFATAGPVGGTPSGKSIVNIDMTLLIDTNAGNNNFFYLQEPATTPLISGRAFEDVNVNGVYDVGVDHPLQGVQMDLGKPGSGEDNAVVHVAYAITDHEGLWEFTGLETSVPYRVLQPAIEGLSVFRLTPGTGGGTTAESIINGIVLSEDQSATGYDFASFKTNTVSGKILGAPVGSSDPTVGMGGVRVIMEVVDDHGTNFKTTHTASDGSYSFPDLRPGTYSLLIEVTRINNYFLDYSQAGPTGGTGGDGDVGIDGIPLTGLSGTNAGGNNFIFYEKVSAPVPFTFDATQPLTYLDMAGNKVTLSLVGPGSGTAYFQGTDIVEDDDDSALTLFASPGAPATFLEGHNTILEVAISGSTAKTTFRVDVMGAKAGTIGTTKIPVIEVTGDIGTVLAPRVTFEQSFAISGGVGSITLGDQVRDSGGQADLSFGASSAFKAGTSLTFGLVDNLSIYAPDAKIAQLMATNWADSGAPDGIKAASINALTITGGSSADGDFMADLILTGAGIGDEDPTLNLVNIAGAITDCVWDIQGNIERINTRSGGELWVLRASGLLAYLTTSKSLIESKLEVQSIGVLSVRQHLLDTQITTGEELLPTQFSMAAMSVGGTIINTQIDSQNTGLGTMLVTGNIMEFSIHASVLTRLNTGLSVYNTVIEAGLIGSIFVSLDMMNSSIHATRGLTDGKVSMGNLTVYAIAQDVEVISSGSVDNMRFGHLVDSLVTVGVELGEGGMEFLQSETGQVAHLNTLYLSGTIGYTDFMAMSDSDIFAGHIGSTRVYSVDESVEGHFGITVNSLDVYQRRQSSGAVLTLRNLANDGGEDEIVDSAGSYRLTLVEIPDDSEIDDD